ncbi:hypothetical protein D9M70_419820 [compost metagenome]
MSAQLRLRLIKVRSHLLRDGQGLRLVHVQQVAHAIAELLASLCKPDGMHVALDKLKVGQVQSRRIDLTVNHAHRVTEVILVMRTLRRAVSDDQGRLPCSTRTTASLRVVGWRGRHVAHVHRVQRGNVDAQFHGGRTKQDRQPLQCRACLRLPFSFVLVGEAEAGLPFEPVILLDLGSMFACFKVEQLMNRAIQQRGNVLIQGTEERVVVGRASTLP